MFEKNLTITVTNVNEAPTNITLSKASIAENNSVNAVIGTLKTTDEDASDSHTYTLLSGSSDFRISNDSLYASKSFNYETKNSYPIKIRTSDGNGVTFEKDFTITISNVNDAPTNIMLSKASITENNSVNAVIGTLKTTDEDASDSHTYTLVSGGANFNFNGNQLRATNSLDYETATSYNITIRTSDGKGGTFEKDFTITIRDVDGEKGTMTYNGKIYKTIQIGKQWWLAENLNDASHSKGRSACYNDNDGNCDTYGRLYDWEAAKALADQIPGWRLATDAEWVTLREHVGNNPGGRLKAGGSSGFAALLGGLGGLGVGIGEDFDNLGNYGYFWSASPYGNGFAWVHYVHAEYTVLTRYSGNRTTLLSVRLIQDR